MSWTLASEGMEGLPESRAAWREGGRENMFMACIYSHKGCMQYVYYVYCGNYKASWIRDIVHPEKPWSRGTYPEGFLP